MKKKQHRIPLTLAVILLGITGCQNTDAPKAETEITEALEQTERGTEALTEKETALETETQEKAEQETALETETSGNSFAEPMTEEEQENSFAEPMTEEELENDFTEPMTGEEQGNSLAGAMTEEEPGNGFAEPMTGDGQEENLETRAITGEETLFFEDFLNQIQNYGFALSEYTRPEEVDLNQVLYNGAGIKQSEPLSQEEVEAYRQVAEHVFTTDIIKIRTDDLESFLMEKLGISLAEMARRFPWTYLKEYDAWYTEHGDTNGAEVHLLSGQVSGEQYILHVSANGRESDMTLRKTGEESYQFVSNIYTDTP